MRVLSLGIALLLAAAGSHAQQSASADINALKQLSILELSQIQVTSVSRTTERLSDAAAASVVVSHQDIRRDGATHVPDVVGGLRGL
jgi:iron complex outermembrane receptor protein